MLNKSLVKNISFFGSWKYIFILFIVFFSANFISILNHTFQWDSLYVANLFSNGLINNWCDQQGAELDKILYALMPSFSVIEISLVIFVCYFLASVFLFFTLINTNIFSKREALFISSYFSVYPAFAVGYESVLMPYAVSFLLFYFGFFVLIIGLYKKYNWLYIFIVAFAFYISFFMESLLVFFYPLLLGFIIINYKRNMIYVKKVLTLSVLPIIFFFTKKIISPTHGYYAKYNNVQFSFHYMAREMFNSVKAVTIDQLMLLKTFSGVFYILAVFLLIGFFIFLYLNKIREDNSSKPIPVYYIILFSIILLFAAIFPYLVVYKPPSIEGFMTRNSILISFPMALFLISIHRIIEKKSAKLSLLLFCVLISLFSSILVFTKIKWKNREIKLFALNEFVKKHTQVLQKYDLIAVEDKTVYGYDDFRDYEINYFLRKSSINGSAGFEIPASFYSDEKTAVNNFIREYNSYGQDAKFFFMYPDRINLPAQTAIIEISNNENSNLKFYFKNKFLHENSNKFLLREL